MVLLEKSRQLTLSDFAARDGASHSSKCMDQLGDGSCFIGVSPAMHALRQYAELLAKIDVPVLITGEVGSGKETVARLIHALSQRSANPFVAITCAAMPGHTLEEELFEIASGILGSGLPSRKVENCQHGTVFLKDIVDMPMANQTQLIHILKEHQFFPKGNNAPTDVDIRIVAATGSRLKQAVAEHKFRSDLYYSLSAFVLHVPPLRERREDIPLLLDHFLRQEANHFGLAVRRLSSEIMGACEVHSWPGNLHQLQNVIRQYAVVGDEQLLLHSLQQNSTTYRRLAPGERDQEPGESRPGLKSLVRVVRDRTEKDLIVSALEETGWNRKLASQKLGISYRSLLYKIEEHHLSAPGKRSAAG